MFPPYAAVRGLLTVQFSHRSEKASCAEKGLEMGDGVGKLAKIARGQGQEGENRDCVTVTNLSGLVMGGV